LAALLEEVERVVEGIAMGETGNDKVMNEVHSLLQ